MSEKIKKTNWNSTFKLIGRAKIFDNSFKIDEVSQSGWQYNNLNLGVDCGEKYGNVYANLMGGFSQKQKGVIYVHGKKEDGSDDWRYAMQLGQKYHKGGKNPDEYLEEIIKKVNKK